MSGVLDSVDLANLSKNSHGACSISILYYYLEFEKEILDYGVFFLMKGFLADASQGSGS